MNKVANTVIFMVVAVLINLLLLTVFFIFGFVLLSLAMNRWPSFAESQMASGISVFCIFIFSIGLTFFIYNKLIIWASRKFDLENKLHPIFSRRNKK